MARGSPEVQFRLPTIERWHQVLLIALFALYVVELVVMNLGFDLYAALAWHGFPGGVGAGGFQPWQPVTRFLVQGPQVPWVLLSLLVLYFFLPAMENVVTRRQLGVAVAFGALGGTIVPLAMDALGFAGGITYGWSPLVFSLFALFGLARPEETIWLVMFPLKAKWILWGSLVIALLQLLVVRSLDTFQTLGVWLGVVGWWHGFGPGARRRQLSRSARAIERELQGGPRADKLRVIDGGKSKPQGRQGGDDQVH
ncbi:MAG: hypothetical protein ABMB14_12090 [Myxococcota bacterium]